MKCIDCCVGDAKKYSGFDNKLLNHVLINSRETKFSENNNNDDPIRKNVQFMPDIHLVDGNAHCFRTNSESNEHFHTTQADTLFLKHHI